MAEVYQSNMEGAHTAQGTPLVERKTAKVVAGGSGIGALCGLGAIVLTILGLIGLMPVVLLSIAVIVAGVALVFEGGAIMARHQDLQAAAAAEAGHAGEVEVEMGMCAEYVGGITGIVLGILALLHVATLTLLPIAAIVFGATLLLGSGTDYRLNELPVPEHDNEYGHHTHHRAASGTAGADVLIGLGGLTLGILALVGVAHGAAPVLSLVALLAIGVAELISGSALSTRMTRMFHH